MNCASKKQTGSLTCGSVVFVVEEAERNQPCKDKADCLQSYSLGEECEGFPAYATSTPRSTLCSLFSPNRLSAAYLVIGISFTIPLWFIAYNELCASLHCKRKAMTDHVLPTLQG